MKLNCRTQSQRDPRWGAMLLGYNTLSKYNIYNYGCLITTFGNYIGKDPAEVNQILKDNGGFTAGAGNFIWGKSTALGLKQTYISPWYEGEVTPQGITKLKETIVAGFPCVMEVDFNPATQGEEQHFVLGAGIDEQGNILVVDPWEGQWETWSEAATKRNVYQFRVYDKKMLPEVIQEMVTMPKTQADDFERVKAGWNTVREKLNVEDSVPIVVGEVEKFLGFEKVIRDQEKTIIEAKTEINNLKTEITRMQIENGKQAEEASVLTVKVVELEKEQSITKDGLTKALQRITELENDLATADDGWTLIRKGLAKLVGRG